MNRFAKFLDDISRPKIIRIAHIVAIVIVLATMVLVVRSCSVGRDRAAQGKQDIRSAEALAETAKDAAKTVIDQADEEAGIDDLVNQTVKEIADAPDEKVARRAAVRAICSLPEYRDDAACKLH